MLLLEYVDSSQLEDQTLQIRQINSTNFWRLDRDRLGHYNLVLTISG